MYRIRTSILTIDPFDHKETYLISHTNSDGFIVGFDIFFIGHFCRVEALILVLNVDCDQLLLLYVPVRTVV